jgi:FlaA1/EpsC-like NDP-sugar epimerase
MPQTAIIVGLPETSGQVERQLDLMPDRPVVLGWVAADPGGAVPDPHADGTPAVACPAPSAPLLGTIDQLESVVARRRPALALVCLPAAMGDRITSIRTRLRRLAVPDRFMPTLRDQLEGVGPRTHLDIDPGTLLDRPSRLIDREAVRRLIEGRRILITGAGGSIGSELARLIASFDPAYLALIDRSENALFEIDRQIARRAPALRRTALLHDVVEAGPTLHHFRRLRPHVVLHTAAHKHVGMMEEHPGAAVDNNLFGTKSVVDAADASGADRFVMISTDKAINPASVMGATKRLAEQYVQHVRGSSSTVFAIVRFGNVLGSTGSVLDIWSRQLAEGGPLTVTDPRMTRYFMTIPEAALLVMQAAVMVGPGVDADPVFLLDMDRPIRIVDLACRFLGAHGLQEALPGRSARPDLPTVRIVYTGARPGEKLHEELWSDRDAIRPTAHPDINIWELPSPDRRYIESMLGRLHRSRRTTDPRALAGSIMELASEKAEPVAA